MGLIGSLKDFLTISESARRDFWETTLSLPKGAGALPSYLQQQQLAQLSTAAEELVQAFRETARLALGAGKQVQAHWAFGAGADVAKATDQ